MKRLAWSPTMVTPVAGGLLALTACITGHGIDDTGERKQLKRTQTVAAVESEIAVFVNAARSERGLPVLQLDERLAEKARTWSGTMAKERRLYHSPLAEGAPPVWHKLGENVGQGGTARAVHDAFVRSPRHLANLTDPAFTHIGVGAAAGPDKTLYITQVFMQASRSGPPPPVTSRPQAAPSRRSSLPATARPAGSVARRPGPPARTPSPQLLHVLRLLRALDR